MGASFALVQGCKEEPKKVEVKKDEASHAGKLTLSEGPVAGLTQSTAITAIGQT